MSAHCMRLLYDSLRKRYESNTGQSSPRAWCVDEGFNQNAIFFCTALEVESRPNTPLILPVDPRFFTSFGRHAEIRHWLTRFSTASPDCSRQYRSSRL